MTAWNGNANFQFKPIANALVPKGGPKMVPVQVPFNTDDPFFSAVIDLTLAIQQGRIEVVQGVYIDNNLVGDNTTSPVTLTMETSGQQIRVPAGSQGYFPVLAGQQPKFILECDEDNAQPVFIAFLNVPVPAMIWDTSPSGTGSTIVEQGASNRNTLADSWLVQICNEFGQPLGVRDYPFVTAGAPNDFRSLYWVSKADINATSIYAGSVILFSVYATNESASDWAYIKFYQGQNDPPDPTTDTPTAVLGIAPGGTLSWSPAVALSLRDGNVGFVIVSGAADNDVTPVAAEQVTMTVLFNF